MVSKVTDMSVTYTSPPVPVTPVAQTKSAKLSRTNTVKKLVSAYAPMDSKRVAADVLPWARAITTIAIQKPLVLQLVLHTHKASHVFVMMVSKVMALTNVVSLTHAPTATHMPNVKPCQGTVACRSRNAFAKHPTLVMALAAEEEHRVQTTAQEDLYVGTEHANVQTPVTGITTTTKNARTRTNVKRTITVLQMHHAETPTVVSFVHVMLDSRVTVSHV
jgi:hypothetical protein